jgi:hypothetical protein
MEPSVHARKPHPFVVFLSLALGACPGGELIDGDAEGGRNGPATPGRTGNDPGGTVERCGTGLDEDRDGQVDEGCGCEPGTTQPCYAGSPREAGKGLCTMGVQGCVEDGEFGSWEACDGQGSPAEEACGDGVDNDCDGSTDETCHCTPGERRPCYPGPRDTEDVGQCVGGEQRCVDVLDGDPAWGDCEGYREPQPEFCSDGVDGDCDGDVDCDDTDSCGTDPACCVPSEDEFQIEPRAADVVFVADRSGTMMGQLDDGRSRGEGLTEAVRQVLPPLDATHRMSLLVYPRPGSFQCDLAPFPQVSLGHGQGLEIAEALDRSAPETGRTPTYQAVDMAAAHLRSHREDRPQFIVLATDGHPNCSHDTESVSALLRSLHSDRDIGVFVLGLTGSSSVAASLNELAEAGGHPRSGDRKYYLADSTDELVGALSAITAIVGDCVYDLSREATTGGSLVVEHDGMPVPRNPDHGWTFAGMRRDQIRFHGEACARLRRGEVRNVAVRNACGE